jgi:hypothetical protein
MTFKAKVAVCSDTRTKHAMQSEHHAEFFLDMGSGFGVFLPDAPRP